MRRTLSWIGLGEERSEIAHVVASADGLRARGSQIGVHPDPYELRYEVDGDRLAVELVGKALVEVRLDGADFFDLATSPLFNSFPVRRDGLHRGGEAREYVMQWVDVPSLSVSRSEQRYEPVRPGVVRFTTGDFVAELAFDDEGFIGPSPVRIAPASCAFEPARIAIPAEVNRAFLTSRVQSALSAVVVPKHPHVKSRPAVSSAIATTEKTARRATAAVAANNRRQEEADRDCKRDRWNRPRERPG